MNIQMLNDQVSVSGQISADDIPALKSLGIDMLVCNRPDDESGDQENFKLIESAAKQHGLAIVNIPFPSGQHSAQDIARFREVLSANQRVHAYCRSGARSANLWRDAVNSEI